MSKTTDALRRIGVVNPYLFFGSKPHITHRASTGRDPLPSAWKVSERNVDLNDGDGSWYEQGDRWFSHYGGAGARAAALAEAQAWASERFRIGEWARDPFGSYGSASFVAARLAYLLYAVSLLDLLGAGPLTPDELRAKAVAQRGHKTAKPEWFEAAVALLEKRKLIVRSDDGELSAV